MNQQQARYVRTPDTEDDCEELFRADAMFGRVLTVCAAFWIGCVFIAGCFFAGYLP